MNQQNLKENMARAFYLTALELDDRNQKRLARQFAFWAYSLYSQGH
ncbi:MAG: hypothetical protein AABX65_01330 [Nanoarchaeota archaeon]